MMGLDFIYSLGLTAAVVAMFYGVLLMRGGHTATYRLFALCFLAVFSAILWLQPYPLTRWLVYGALGFLGMLFALAFITKRPPSNRRETKALLDQLQNEKRLAGFLEPHTWQWYWPLLVLIVWSACYRLVCVYRYLQ